MHSHHHHIHGNDHQHEHDPGTTRNLSIAFFLNLAFTIIEFIGGIITNSFAILSDALHDLGDSFALGMSWYFEKLSKKKKNKLFSYGYRRFSLLAALINAIILLIGSVVIMSFAIPKIFSPGAPDAVGMIYFALVGIVFNGLGVLVLKRGGSINERVVMLHLLEDVLGWFAILVGSILILYFDIPVLDPILSVLIAVFIIYNAAKALKEVLKILLQAVPDELLIHKIDEAMSKISGVKSVHDTHIWSLDGRINILTTHLVVEDTNVTEMISIKDQARKIAREQNIQHATVEIGLEEEECGIRDY
jgi:cobalt-zinc-cadmium efflux system protein